MSDPIAYSTDDTTVVSAYRDSVAAMKEFARRVVDDARALGNNKGVLRDAGGETSMPFNDAAKNVCLDALDESATQITHIGVHSLSSEPGTGTNASAGEATGGSPAYARQAVVWGAAASGLKANTGALTFDVPAGTYGFFTYFNHVSTNSGNYRGYAPFGGTPKGFATCDAADVTANSITSSAHGLVNTDRVMVFNVFAETLPAGLTEGVVYFVVGATTDTFQVSLTSGGAAVDITGIGELFFQKIIPEVFGAQGQITVAIGALVLDATAM